MIEAARVAAAPPLARIVVGIDPPASSRPGADACGIVAAGRAEDGCVYVLEDATVKGLAPAGWATRAIALYRRLKADALVAEVNQGGEMVGAVLRNVDPAVPLKTVHATRGKYLRAEPVAAFYAQGRSSTWRRRKRSWRIRCATSGSAGCRRALRPTGSTRWSGR